MIKRKKILFVLTSLVLLISCDNKIQLTQLPIFVGGNGIYSDPNRFGFKDGKGTEVRFKFPEDLTIDKDGNLFVIDWGRIRKVTPDGIVTNFAGNGNLRIKDGKGTEAEVGSPKSIDIDSKENLYFVDLNNSNIRKVTPDGTVSTLDIKIKKSDSDELIELKLNSPSGIAVDKNDAIYINSQGKIYKIVDSVAEILKENNGREPSFERALGMVFDSKNNLYIDCVTGSSVRYYINKFTSENESINFSDTLKDKNPNIAGKIFPHGIAIDDKDNIYIADPQFTFGDYRYLGDSSDEPVGTDSIYKITPDGKIVTVVKDVHLDNSQGPPLAIDSKRGFLYILNNNRSNINRIKLEEK